MTRVAKKRALLKPGRIALYLLVIVVAVIFFIPFYWMIITSLKTARNAHVVPAQWWPNPIQWSNYVRIFQRVRFVTYMKNTLVLAIVPVVGQLIASPMVAYSLAKVPWKGAKIIFPLVLATIMIPWQVTQIPMYITWSRLGLINTFIPLVLPAFFGTPYNIFLLRQFIKGIPDSLLDAARIDGCREVGILYRIIYPLCKPALITVVILVFIGGWNDFNGPLIYLQKSNLYTLSIGLQTFMQTQVTTKEWELLMSASTLFTMPLILIFFIGQKQFVGGIVTTGMKG